MALSLILIGIGLVVPGTATAAALTESEPNDTIAQANYIALGDVVAGSTERQTRFHSRDEDFFVVDVAKAGRLTLDFRFPQILGTDTVYGLRIYGADGEAMYAFDVKGTETGGARVRGQSTFVPTGVIFVEVRAWEDGVAGGKSYTLQLTVAPGDVETESNDTTATADPLALGVGVSGSVLGASIYTNTRDIDVYAITVPKNGRLDLDFRFPSGLGTGTAYSLRVIAADGAARYVYSVAGADSAGTRVRGHAMYLPAGPAYIEVSAYPASIAWGRTYTVKVDVTAGEVETEFNDATSTADTLTLGRAVSGSVLSPRTTTNTPDRDYFSVVVPKTGRATIDLMFPAGLGTGRAYDVTVYSEAGRELYDYALTGAHSDGAWLRAQATMVPAGRVYVEVSAYPGTVAWGKPYSLKVSQVERLSGADRYSTSAAVSKTSFASGVPVAYIASGGGFADALSGAPVAGLRKGPVLLSSTTSIPEGIATELKRLKPKKIIVLGGTGVISDKVVSALKKYTSGSVTRLAGADRYATSAAISKSAFASGVAVAYIAAGADFPDALAGAPVGTVKKAPVLLTATGSLPATIAAELKRLKPKKIVILGAKSSVGDAVVASLKKLTSGGVTRVAGADRYATPAAISASTFSPGVPVVYIANGTQYPDALSGAPVAGVQRGPVLMVSGTSVPSSVAKELARLKPKRIVVLGGTGAVTDAVLGELGRYIVR